MFPRLSEMTDTFICYPVSYRKTYGVVYIQGVPGKTAALDISREGRVSGEMYEIQACSADQVL